MNEYSVRFPLWRPSTPTEPRDWPQLSGALVGDLLAWARDFDENYDPDTGTWPAGYDIERYHEQGALLAARLQNALGPEEIVYWQHWESSLTRKA